MSLDEEAIDLTLEDWGISLISDENVPGYVKGHLRSSVLFLVGSVTQTAVPSEVSEIVGQRQFSRFHQSGEPTVVEFQQICQKLRVTTKVTDLMMAIQNRDRMRDIIRGFRKSTKFTDYTSFLKILDRRGFGINQAASELENVVVETNKELNERESFVLDYFIGMGKDSMLSDAF